MDRDLEVSRTLNIRNAKIVKWSEPSDQVLIGIVDPTPFRGIGDRDLVSRDASSLDSRNAKSWCICIRHIKKWYGLLIWLLHGVSWIGIWKWQEHWTSGMSNSRYAKSWRICNHQIKKWYGPLIWLLYGVSWIGICKWQEHWTSGMSKSWYAKSRNDLNRQIKCWSKGYCSLSQFTPQFWIC